MILLKKILADILAETDIVKNKKSGNVYDVEEHNPETQVLVKKDATAADIAKLRSNKQTKNAFTDTSSLPTESQFKSTFGNLQLSHKFEIPQSVKSNKKIPQKYFTLIERLCNTKFVEGETTKITDFIDQKSGAGTIKSQAGELLTMMALALDDEEWDTISKQLSDTCTLNGNKGIINSSWVEAATRNRQAIKLLSRTRFKSNNIDGVAWDNQDEVNELGFNYNDKEPSTDIFVKVGKNVLQVSLKKDAKVNLLNSTANNIYEWDPSIKGTDIDINKYNINQEKKFANLFKQNENAINDALSVKATTELLRNGTPKIIVVSPDEYNATKKANKTAFVIRNVNDLLEYSKEKNNKEALARFADVMQKRINKKKYLDEQDNFVEFNKAVKVDRAKYISNVVNSIASEPKLKHGFLKHMTDVLPIKSVFEGKESIAIGDTIFCKETFKNVFGVDDIKDIQQKLIVVQPKTGTPYLAYSASTNSEKIPIATMRINEKPPNSGMFPFTMEMHPEFANRIKQATEILSQTK